MQHHVHAGPRNAPHMRTSYHHMTMHAGPPPSQQTPHHVGSIPATVATAQPHQAQHIREPSSSRLNHQYAQSLHNNSNQMQKIRQEHQHLSNNTKCSQPPTATVYSGITHQSQQQQHNVTTFNQLPHHQPHMAHIGGYHQPPALHNTHQTHYYVSNKSKYNVNNNNNSHLYNANNNYVHAPKTILQNTNRAVKTNVKTTDAQTNLVTVTETTTHSNNIVITPDPNATETIPLNASVQTNGHSEEVDTNPVEDGGSNLDDSTEHSIGATLANEDTSVPRNSKDKTPMCLVNELARYNKITHQYRLTGERGPAHSKTFTVTLRLGEEEYSADGFKIKKAQHLAAGKAIEQTKYKHPPPKVRRSDENSSSRMHITPTVELNALAMKLGQRTYYLLDPAQMPPSDAIVQPEFSAPPQHIMPHAAPLPHAAYMRRNGNFLPGPPPYMPAMPTQQRFGHRGYPPKYSTRFPITPQLGGHLVPPHGPYGSLPTTPSKITLFVGKQKFVGVGRTLQQAKHDAAARALQVLKTQTTNSNEDSLDDSMDDGDKKSPISQVHEIGIKRSMTVHFKVLREEGPAHMKNFITACIVGSIVTEGEGNGKKISKKRAADKMLIELQKLPPLTPTKQTPMKRIKVKTPGKGAAGTAATPNVKPERRKRLGAAFKEKPLDTDDSENPITKLIQLQQNRKEKEPVFELIAKNGNENSRRREFIMEVTAGNMVARGTGNNKKLAKRNAAQNLLTLMESGQTSTTADSGDDTKPESISSISAPPAVATASTTTNLNEPNASDVPMVSTPAGPVPGILILRQNKKHAAKKKESAKPVNAEMTQVKQIEADVDTNDNATSGKSQNDNNNTSTTDTTSKSGKNADNDSNTSKTESNDTKNTNGNTTNSNGGVSNNSGTSSSSSSVHMKEQLLYLAKLLGFEVNFSDYPKGNHNDFLTIVTLSSDPPQICHGVGSNAEESQNDAAKSALKILSELGLNNAKK